METFKIKLHPLQKTVKYQFLIWIFATILYILAGIIYLINNNQLGWIWILGGLFYFVALYYSKNYSLEYFCELNDNFIKLQKNTFKKIIIKWDDIKEINIKPINIRITKVDNSTQDLSLAKNTTYQNAIDIKSKLKEFAKEKNIIIN